MGNAPADIPIINGQFTLQRFNAKGGWTFIELPGLKSNSKFGMIRVKGIIDAFHFNQYQLMRLKNGNHFLAVNAFTRKSIGKSAGDTVQLLLFEDNSAVDIPPELIVCLQDEPIAHERFMKLAPGYQKEFISWIYAAKQEATKAGRIAGMINKLIKGETLSKVKIK